MRGGSNGGAAARTGRFGAAAGDRHRAEPGVAGARPHAPVLRVRERRAAHQRAARVPRGRGPRPDRHRHPVPQVPRPSRGPAGQAAGGRGPDARPRRRGPVPPARAPTCGSAGAKRAPAGRDKSSILADTLEALIGAVYFECGLAAADNLVHRLFDPVIDRSAGLGAGLDWKTSLQELTASGFLGVPEYHVEESGPDHQKFFRASVRVGGRDYGIGDRGARRRKPSSRRRRRPGKPSATEPRAASCTRRGGNGAADGWPTRANGGEQPARRPPGTDRRSPPVIRQRRPSGAEAAGAGDTAPGGAAPGHAAPDAAGHGAARARERCGRSRSGRRLTSPRPARGRPSRRLTRAGTPRGRNRPRRP